MSTLFDMTGAVIDQPGLQASELIESLRRQPPFRFRIAPPCARPAAWRVDENDIEHSVSPQSASAFVGCRNDCRAGPPCTRRELAQPHRIGVKRENFPAVLHFSRQGERVGL